MFYLYLALASDPEPKIPGYIPVMHDLVVLQRSFEHLPNIQDFRGTTRRHCNSDSR